MTKYFLLFALFFLFLKCKKNTFYTEKVKNSELFHSSMKKLSDIVVYDIFSPPVASRIYMYPSVAAYETIRFINPSDYPSLAGRLNELKSISPPSSQKTNLYLASIYAFLEVGKAMIFSEQKIIAFQKKFDEKMKKTQVPKSVISASKKYGKKVALHILDWSKGDQYSQTRTYSKYAIRTEEQYWKPTPPDYMDGIEPHWNKIRTLVLDSANQFVPAPPAVFNLNPKSKFYKELMEVYEIGKKLNDEQRAIAQFWDCNPYVSHHYGHAMLATKKITPGGHWIGITTIANRTIKNNFINTVNSYAKVSIALFDAFINCWDEKWRSVLVRPETLINEHYDVNWIPLLQTPPFPEYTSGHSVISRAAAVMLTDIFGENFKFRDTSEVEYGLPARDFNSFIEAAEEAAISRLYGGIHYRMAIEEGVWQGQKVGEYVVKHLKNNLKVSLNE